MNILIPAAGAGKRFKAAGYGMSKPLILVDGTPMVTQVIRNVSQPGDSIVMLAPRGVLVYGARTIVVDEVTDGAARTALLAKTYIDSDESLLIVNADQLVDWPHGIHDFYQFAVQYDGAVVCFAELTGNPKWSFADVADDSALIRRIAEKDPISLWATVGLYYWRRGTANW